MRKADLGLSFIILIALAILVLIGFSVLLVQQTTKAETQTNECANFGGECTDEQTCENRRGIVLSDTCQEPQICCVSSQARQN